MPVTKLDAAVRQLETAITLWFGDGDPVSICTLSSAAHEIIDSLNGGFGGHPTMLQGQNIRPEYKELALALFRASPNFFKHAGKDPHETHYFAVKGQVTILLDAVATYNSWSVGRRPIFQVFIRWMQLAEPRFFTELSPLPGVSPAMEAEIVRAGKSAYFNAALPIEVRKQAGLKSQLG